MAMEVMACEPAARERASVASPPRLLLPPPTAREAPYQAQVQLLSFMATRELLPRVAEPTRVDEVSTYHLAVALSRMGLWARSTQAHEEVRRERYHTRVEAGRRPQVKPDALYDCVDNQTVLRAAWLLLLALARAPLRQTLPNHSLPHLGFVSLAYMQDLADFEVNGGLTLSHSPDVLRQEINPRVCLSEHLEPQRRFLRRFVPALQVPLDPYAALEAFHHRAQTQARAQWQAAQLAAFEALRPREQLALGLRRWQQLHGTRKEFESHMRAVRAAEHAEALDYDGQAPPPYDGPAPPPYRRVPFRRVPESDYELYGPTRDSLLLALARSLVAELGLAGAQGLTPEHAPLPYPERPCWELLDTLTRDELPSETLYAATLHGDLSLEDREQAAAEALRWVTDMLPDPAAFWHRVTQRWALQYPLARQAVCQAQRRPMADLTALERLVHDYVRVTPRVLQF